MDQVGLPQREPTVVFEDNWACIHLSRNSVLHHKSKHIDVRVYHLRDLCKQGVMTLLKIGTADQAADALTKALPSPAFIQHRVMVDGYEYTHSRYNSTNTISPTVHTKHSLSSDPGTVLSHRALRHCQ
eukprot:2251009-Rhodomonas_salina.2